MFCVVITVMYLSLINIFLLLPDCGCDEGQEEGNSLWLYRLFNGRCHCLHYTMAADSLPADVVDAMWMKSTKSNHEEKTNGHDWTAVWEARCQQQAEWIDDERQCDESKPDTVQSSQRTHDVTVCRLVCVIRQHWHYVNVPTTYRDRDILSQATPTWDNTVQRRCSQPTTWLVQNTHPAFSTNHLADNWQ